MGQHCRSDPGQELAKDSRYLAAICMFVSSRSHNEGLVLDAADRRNPAPVDSLSNYWQGLVNLRWCRISAMNSINVGVLVLARTMRSRMP